MVWRLRDRGRDKVVAPTYGVLVTVGVLVGVAVVVAVAVAVAVAVGVFVGGGTPGRRMCGPIHTAKSLNEAPLA
jgi:hypothetical protein